MTDCVEITPLKEGVEDSKRFKYEIKTQNHSTPLMEKPVEDLTVT